MDKLKHPDLTLYSQVVEAQQIEKATLVLLPGFTGSSRTWTNYIEPLSRDHRLVLLDALGFGKSPKPLSIDYSLADHLKAVEHTLQTLSVKEPFHLVGYSMGSLMALAYTRRFSAQVDKLVLIALPLYPDEQEARRTVKSSSLFIRLMGTDNWLAQAACQFMCTFQPLFQKIAPVLSPTVPADVARDGMLHNWSSYSQTLKHLIFEADGADWLRDVSATNHDLLLLHGTADKLAPIENIRTLTKGTANLDLVEFDQADHSVIFTWNKNITQHIISFLQKT
jgi:pimeloyl-ACP methyl ester carboxylesterase